MSNSFKQWVCEETQQCFENSDDNTSCEEWLSGGRTVLIKVEIVPNNRYKNIQDETAGTLNVKRERKQKRD